MMPPLLIHPPHPQPPLTHRHTLEFSQQEAWQNSFKRTLWWKDIVLTMFYVSLAELR